MRTTFVNLAIPIFGAVLSCILASTADARGPAGGTPTIATPSFGGSRGGSVGSSGFSFGSAGISFGGGGRIAIGTGAGGISFGTGGRGAPTPNFNFNRSQIPAYPSNRGKIPVMPNFRVVPPTRLPAPVPLRVPSQTWTAPQTTFQPPTHTVTVSPTVVEVQPNELPKLPASEPIATDPEINPSGLVGRQITQIEVKRARQFFQRRLLDLANVLQKRLPPAEYDAEQLAAEMLEHSIPVDVQIQLIDTLKRGDYDHAGEIWIAVLPHVEIPFRPSRIRVLFLRFYVMIERGYVSYPVVQELFENLPPEALRPSTCCGADDLLVQIEEQARISQAMAGISAETPTDFQEPETFSKPRPNESPYAYASAEIQSGEFAGKPNAFEKPGATGDSQPYGRPGEPVPLPTGPVNIVYHPKLPDRQVVVVNAQTVMVGTGGRGDFRIERGYVAEALGHKIGNDSPLPGNQSDLVRSGVVVINPTQAKVRFVFGSHEVTLEPGYQQAFNAEGVISFDRGDDKKTARYTLKPGTYEFEVGTDGWNLRSKQYAIVVSNKGNIEPFHYIVQGEQVSLAPDEQKTHESSYPILVRFDRGDGSATRQIRWDDNQGTVQVAINPADNLWDLFAANEPEAKDLTLQPTPDFVPAF